MVVVFKLVAHGQNGDGRVVLGLEQGDLARAAERNDQLVQERVLPVPAATWASAEFSSVPMKRCATMIRVYARIMVAMAISPTHDVLQPVSGCTCARLRRLTRRMTAFYDRELAPTGLRLTQYSLLATLRREANDGAIAVSDLASAMDMDRTTLTRNLRPLLDQGLVELAADPADARVRRALITAKGNAAFLSALPYWRIAQDFVNRTLGVMDVGALHDWLDRVTPAFRAEPSEA